MIKNKKFKTKKNTTVLVQPKGKNGKAYKDLLVEPKIYKTTHFVDNNKNGDYVFEYKDHFEVVPKNAVAKVGERKYKKGPEKGVISFLERESDVSRELREQQAAFTIQNYEEVHNHTFKSRVEEMWSYEYPEDLENSKRYMMPGHYGLQFYEYEIMLIEMIETDPYALDKYNKDNPMLREYCIPKKYVKPNIKRPSEEE